MCGRYASKAQVSKVWVDPRSAILHHYKDCNDSWLKTQSCDEYFVDMVQDDIVLLYEDSLKNRVSAVEEDMKAFFDL